MTDILIGNHDEILSQCSNWELEILQQLNLFNTLQSNNEAIFTLALLARKVAGFTHPDHGAPRDAEELFQKLLLHWKAKISVDSALLKAKTHPSLQAKPESDERKPSDEKPGEVA